MFSILYTVHTLISWLTEYTFYQFVPWLYAYTPHISEFARRPVLIKREREKERGKKYATN